MSAQATIVLRSRPSLSRSQFVATILFVGFVLQYNFLFSAEFLWLNFWSGSGIRTAVSFFVIFLCFIPFFMGMTLRIHRWSVAPALMAYATYGLLLGLLNNEPTAGLIAEGIFWIEIVLYFVILYNLDRDSVSSLIRAMIIYSTFNSVASIGYFWMIRDQIAVAALVGGTRVVRIADLLAPLILLLHILHNTIYKERRLRALWAVPTALLVLLGMFRSVWAAFVISYVLANVLFPTRSSLKQLAISSCGILALVMVFEVVFEQFFGVENVVLGRIVAGIGTEDSLGRLSAASEVLTQFIADPIQMILGAGFGKQVWFVNDFGEGEVYALQPLGSLSNYYVVFLYQVGLLVCAAYIVYLAHCAAWIANRRDRSHARVLAFIAMYFFAQWLTFPTSIHYPVAMILGLYFSIAIRMPSK